MNPTTTHKLIQYELKQLANAEFAQSQTRFFKEPIKNYGIRNPEVNHISKQYIKQLVHLSKEEVFELCQALWASGYLEEGFVACHLSFSRHKAFEESDFNLFERWVQRYITNWATCDTFCNHTLGAYFEMFPHQVSLLMGWTGSENRWVRRASAVSLIIPARKGIFLDQSFRIADLLMEDTDDLVQKGYGWLLKVSGEAHQKEVFNYLMEKRDVMPRTAFRYALEKMPKELKDIAMGRK